MRRWLVVAGALLAIAAPAAAGPERGITLELFERPGCPRCIDARALVEEIADKEPDLRVVIHDIQADARARARLLALCEQAGISTPGVPAIHIAGSVVVGFAGREATRRAVERLIEGGQESTVAGEACSSEVESACDDRVELPVAGSVRPEEIGLPLFTIVVGLIDGFNPCATWVLVFLLSFLVNLRDRRRMLTIGGVFVAASGAVYYAFMAAWLNLFLLVGMSRVVMVALGVVALAVGAVNVKDFFAFHRGFSLSIPDSAKPGIYARARRILAAERLGAALVGALVLAVVVNLVELLCTAGLPAIYTAVLARHDLGAWQYHGYLALYIAAYMLDDALLLGIAVVTLSKRKLTERGGRILKLVSGAVMLGLGAMLIARPEWLAW